MESQMDSPRKACGFPQRTDLRPALRVHSLPTPGAYGWKPLRAFHTAPCRVASAARFIAKIFPTLRNRPRRNSYTTRWDAGLVQSNHWMVPLITRPNHENWSLNARGRWRIPPANVRFRGKNVFLAGGGTISYGESLMGIVEAYRLGTIIGEPTAGTNGNICNFDIPGFQSLPFTGMRVLKNDGSPHHGVGIHPHILVRPTARGVMEGRDEVLDKALAFVEEARTGEV